MVENYIIDFKISRIKKKTLFVIFYWVLNSNDDYTKSEYLFIKLIIWFYTQNYKSILH